MYERNFAWIFYNFNSFENNFFFESWLENIFLHIFPIRKSAIIDHIPTYTEHLTSGIVQKSEDRSSTVLYISSIQHFSFLPLKQSKGEELKGRKYRKSIEINLTDSIAFLDQLSH